jgi:hypothetical protein
MEPALQKDKEMERKTKAQVLKVFNWSKESADPVLLVAACAFWDEFSERDGCKPGWRKKVRVSMLD